MMIAMRPALLFMMAVAFPLSAGEPVPKPAKEPPPAESPAELEKEIDRLVEKLGDKEFEVRHGAQKRLLEIALKDEDRLFARLPKEHPDFEVRAGCEEIRKSFHTRFEANEKAAIRTLRSLQEAGSVYKKLVLSDADGNGVGEYPADVPCMVDANRNPLTGLVVTKGVSHGYRFFVRHGSRTPENTFYAWAVPVEPGKTGRLTFCQANDGIGYASPSGAVPPADYLPADGGRGSPGGDFVVVQE